MANLTGNIAMVTGGATGIGAAIAERLAMQGADDVTLPRKSGHEDKPSKSCIIPLSEG